MVSVLRGGCEDFWIGMGYHPFKCKKEKKKKKDIHRDRDANHRCFIGQAIVSSLSFEDVATTGEWL